MSARILKNVLNGRKPKVLLAGGMNGFLALPLRGKLLEAGCVVHSITKEEFIVPVMRFEGSYAWSRLEKHGDGVNQDYDYVINLSGSRFMEPDVNWCCTEQEMEESRIGTNKILRDIIDHKKKKPRAFITASHHAIYPAWKDMNGNSHMNDNLQYTEDYEFTKEDKNEYWTDFVMEWEQSAVSKIDPDSYPVIPLRMANVIGQNRNDGTLFLLKKWIKRGLGTPYGSGLQPYPWISLEDAVRSVVHMITKMETGANVSGPYNIVSPEQHTQAEFMELLCKYWNRKMRSILNTNERIQMFLTEPEYQQMFLEGRQMSSSKLQKLGYQFRTKTLTDSLKPLTWPNDFDRYG